ncbi:hypothetical protein RvY_04244-2 [Ramazzottius varieornatus]|uniref:Uncharacterized protein n=1 Tax=Ramazzottius varieornatus TaxID=947166 RepID=A0A1D1URP0_RAMVA|nr:hypothetical protein RvY_04244-2 [Ramazzottius varieornatus]
MLQGPENASVVLESNINPETSKCQELASRPCNIVTSQYPVNCSSLIQQAHAMTRATAAHASTLPKRRVFLELWYIRDQISNMNAKQTDMGRSASVKASVPLRTAASSRILLQRLVNAFVTNTSVPNGTTPSSANVRILVDGTNLIVNWCLPDCSFM